MTKEDLTIYNKAVRRLSVLGIKDPTAQIIALEKEIDYYRDKIKRYESKGYRPTLHIIDEVSQNEHLKEGVAKFFNRTSAKPKTKVVVKVPDGVYTRDEDGQGYHFHPAPEGVKRWEIHKSVCPTCERLHWGDPKCQECDEQNGFKYYKPMEE